MYPLLTYDFCRYFCSTFFLKTNCPEDPPLNFGTKNAVSLRVDLDPDTTRAAMDAGNPDGQHSLLHGRGNPLAQNIFRQHEFPVEHTIGPLQNLIRPPGSILFKTTLTAHGQGVAGNFQGNRIRSE